MQHYLYQHRRLDTQEIFYVGIGQKNFSRACGHRTEYERAYAKSKRSTFWKSVTKKTKYIVEIVSESPDVDFIRLEEQKLIAQYGRRCCDPKGTLVNFQEGGERITGPRHRNIRVRQETLEGVLIKIWDRVDLIQIETGYLKTNIVKCCRKKQITAYGFKWFYEDRTEFKNIRATAARKKTTNRRVGIIATHKVLGTVHIFTTGQECANFLQVHRTTVYKYLNKGKQHKLYNIEYNSW
jgi:hypothetical protein